ncbi:MAG: hypothetical protein ORN98_11005 [Alphaproteobacteria bacterium]|nr:hypothetical protein [Alphaproteobacteria bacterium]
MKEYIIYVAKYLGIALIAGSVVHAGTLTEDMTRYILIGVAGLALFLVGEVLEEMASGDKINLRIFALATLLSLATGFMSGGVQHYLENPSYAGAILGIGILVSYVTFMLKSGKKITKLPLVITIIVSLAMSFGSFQAVKFLGIEQGPDHHAEAGGSHHETATETNTMHETGHEQESDDASDDHHKGKESQSHKERAAHKE